MTKVAFQTLGCRANQYQTEVLKSEIRDPKSEIVEFDAKADIYVINTCTVTVDADRTSRKLIRKAYKQNPKARVIVTGCYARLNKQGLRETWPDLEFLPADYSLQSTIPPQQVRTNLMIQDGCDHYCTYCIVPYARGEIKSKPIDQIIIEAKDLVSAGAREIVLTGINLGRYNSNSCDLCSVLYSLRSIPGLLRLRLSSIEPMYLAKELIDTVARTPKVCHHLHIPLQSGDDKVLKQMNRNYTAKDYAELIKYARTQMPDCGITTDIIVGFPGETDQAFQNTVDLVNQIKFSRIHVFSYSRRPGTPAADYPDQIDPTVKKERNKTLHKLRDKYMKEFAERYSEMEILVENEREGMTDNFIKVKGSFKQDEIGMIVKADSRK
jgi:threonylcarbamoyladenosine tRNA methylthiotransferase MtaB